MTNLNFTKNAEAFAAKHQDRLIFLLLKYFLACTDSQLNLVIKKIYCQSIPENSTAKLSNSVKSYLKLLGFPFYCLIKKKIFWKRHKLVDYNFETIDKPYFQKWFKDIYQGLTGSKRLTPRYQDSFQQEDVTDNMDITVSPHVLLKLFYIVPLLVLPLYLFSLRYRIKLLFAYGGTLSQYIRFEGYFSRYPCHHFVTYEDVMNHPSRYIAFKQHCDGNLIVIQNGERCLCPRSAFGMVDKYFVFGEAYANMLKALKVHAKQFEAVGALCLNERYQQIMHWKQQAPADQIFYDILFIDQSVYPFHDYTNEKSSKSINLILNNLNRFKQSHPECRIAYQLRPYFQDQKQKRGVIATVQKHMTEGITFLENDGNGESYQNSLLSNLVMTFESTIGFEMMRLGKKVLFVNYSGDPTETLCPDDRFQIDDESADYDRFEAKIEKLLEMNLTEIPPVALERHFSFDGKVQERLAFLINHGGG